MNRRSIALTLVAGLGVFVPACVSDSDPPVVPPDLDAGIKIPEAKIGADTTAIDWGFVNCGTEPPPKSYRVKNDGDKAFGYTLSIEGTAFTVEGPEQGTLAPGAEVTVTLKAKIAGADARVPLEGVLHIDSADLPQGVRVPLKITPEGAMIKLTPGTVGFGEINVGQLATPANVEFENTGFVPVGIGVQVPAAEFGLSWTNVPEPFTIAGTEKKSLTATFGPTSDGKKEASLAITYTGPVCGAPPKTLELRGDGVYQPVTVTGSPVDFGAVDCGTTAGAKTIKIKNDNAFSVTWTAAFGANPSPFTVAPTSGTVASGGETTVTITPKAMTAPRVITANAYGDTLTITTNAPNDTPHVVDLKQSARGALLSGSVNGAFGAQTIQLTAQRTLTVNNTGNAAASVRLTTSSPFSVTPASPTGVNVPANGANTATVSYSPTAVASSNGSLSYVVVGPNCGATPSAHALSGNGVASIYSSTGAFTGMNVTCGIAPTAAAQSITVRNDATALGQLVIKNIAVTGPFTVSPTTLAPIAPNGSAQITVTPQAAVIGTDRGGTQQSGTLTFTTNDPSDANVSFALRRSLHGANIEYGAAAAAAWVGINSLDFPGCPGQSPVNAGFMIRNAGDLDVATLNGVNVADWTFMSAQGLPSFGLPSGSSLSVTGSYKGTIGTTRPAVNLAPFSVPAGTTGVCIPPPALSLTYTALSSQDARCVIIL